MIIYKSCKIEIRGFTEINADKYTMHVSSYSGSTWLVHVVVVHEALFF